MGNYAIVKLTKRGTGTIKAIFETHEEGARELVKMPEGAASLNGPDGPHEAQYVLIPTKGKGKVGSKVTFSR